MAQPFEQIVQSINNTELRIAVENLFGILGIGRGDKEGSATISAAVTGGVTGNVVGDVTGNLTGDSAGTHTGAVTGDVTGSVDGAIVDGDTLITKTLTPVNAVAATSVLTMADVGVIGDTLTIGADIYELTDGLGIVGTGTIEVDVSGGVTKQQTVTALTAAQVASGTEAVSFTDNADDTMGIASDVAGVLGMLIAFDDSGLTNGSINQYSGTDFLGGTVAGVDGTVGSKGQIEWDASYLYVCVLDNTIADANWERAAIASY